jgi:hypothetical protein
MVTSRSLRTAALFVCVAWLTAREAHAAGGNLPPNAICTKNADCTTGACYFIEEDGVKRCVFASAAIANVFAEEMTASTVTPSELDDVVITINGAQVPCDPTNTTSTKIWNNLAAVPTTATTGQNGSFTSGGSAPDENVFCAITHFHTISNIQKPLTTNTLTVRVLLDSTNTISETDETNNTAELDLFVQNTPPHFTTTGLPTGSVGSTYSYTAIISDLNQNDRNRQTLTLVSAPAGMSISAFATDGSIFLPRTLFPKRKTVTWVPTAVQTGTQTFTLRTCDGDPGVGGAGACTDQTTTVVVIDPAGPPVITSTPPALTTLNENATATYDMTATGVGGGGRG